MSLSNKDNSLNRARSLSLGRQTIDLVGSSDKIDCYKFSLSQTSDFSLSVGKLQSRASVQVKLLNSRGRVLSQFRAGSAAQTKTSSLAAGTYFISVATNGKSGKVKYQFKTAATIAEAGATPATARNIGRLSGRFTTQDSVNTTDSLDYYKFNLNSITDFNAALSGLDERVSMYLYRDSNENGIIDNGEQVDSRYGYRDSSILQILTPGTYYFAVANYYPTRYNLTFTTTSYPDYTPNPEPGDRSTTAQSIGTLSGRFTAKNYVGNLDGADYYKFNVNAVTDFSAVLSGLNERVSMYLYRDFNNNGVIDNGEQLDSRYGYRDSSISQILTPGTYYFAVANYYPTRYDLTLTATPHPDYTPLPDPGERSTTAYDITRALPGRFTAKNYVGNLDTTDFYKFTVNQTKTFEAALSGLNERVSMYLYRDANGNGIIENNEQLDSRYGYRSSSITQLLSTGTYYLAIENYYPTRYDLAINLG